MADTNYSALTAAAAALAAMEFGVNDAGVSKKISLAQLLALQGSSQGNASTATQAATAATLTYLTGSDILVPAGKLRIGTTFRWTLDMTKSAAGTAARNFFVKIGTAGTTADATLLTFLIPLGTAVVDQARAEIIATIRGPLSASCVIRGAMHFAHELATTGFVTTAQPQVKGVTSGTFDATVANLKVGLAFTSGASEVVTFQQVLAEAQRL